jgi:D-alanyl-D-alanine carboxypeptidase
LAGLGLSPDIIRDRDLPLQIEATELEVVSVDAHGREHRLIPAAAQAWRTMQQAAASQQVTLSVVSAFRGLERQAEIIRGKMACGLPVEAIFCASAPPGYSEHHTGRAVDITTPGAKPLEEEFETTEAFAWLTANAARFGFSLSYPRANRYGFMYEPWHWYFGRE